MIEPKPPADPAKGGSAEPRTPEPAESTFEGLPTRVRSAEELSHLDEGSHWDASTLPVPPPAEGDDDTPTLGPVAEAAPGARETVDDPRLPAGQNSFKIGEVAKIVGVKPYVLRYWESELAQVQPEKTDTRQRRYRREDVATLLKVQRLRHDEKLSLARIRVLMRRGETDIPASAVTPSGLAEADRADLRRELNALRRQVLDLLEAVED